ncbi:hypothetical protein SK128_014592, partial [Halocaridina rubra]
NTDKHSANQNFPLKIENTDKHSANQNFPLKIENTDKHSANQNFPLKIENTDKHSANQNFPLKIENTDIHSAKTVDKAIKQTVDEVLGHAFSLTSIQKPECLLYPNTRKLESSPQSY